MEKFRINLKKAPVEQSVDPYREFSSSLNEIVENINILRLSQTQMNVVYSSMDKLIGANAKLAEMLSQIDSCSISQYTKQAENYICREIKNHATVYRRNKLCSSSEMYVEPEEKSIGLHWKSKFETQVNSAHHTLDHSTFQYVPIIKTLNALFLDADFKNAYMSNEHTCTDGVFERFCCGKIYKNNEFFERNPNALQLQFAIDDFEICSPLKTKAGTQKLCAIYMQVMNLSPRFLSRLENIYLVALCKSYNLKLEYTSLDNILELIVFEIKSLEENGLNIGNGVNLKGTMISFTFDNLGGNSLYGFVEGFRAKYFCRMCDLSNEECSSAVAEDPSRMRNISEYNLQLIQLPKSEKKNINIKGVKKHCLLNSIGNFHIFQNRNVDLMHDVLEGAVPKLLHNLFSYCVDKRILSAKELQDRVRDHNYGISNRCNKPSFLDLDKLNLNQNASQSYCLMINIPFMLIDKKDKLMEIWICVESLLQIMQICFSDSITDTDLVLLEELVKTHLKNFSKLFKCTLKPKHHFLTHYASVIRSSGPVINNWMMRMEAKHKFFTDHAKRIKNCINVAKSLAVDHQQYLLNSKKNFFEY